MQESVSQIQIVRMYTVSRLRVETEVSVVKNDRDYVIKDSSKQITVREFTLTEFFSKLKYFQSLEISFSRKLYYLDIYRYFIRHL